MSKPRTDAVGGYLPLELPARRPQLYPHALRFQSARAAFLALLRQGKPRRVWMPHYICDSMFEPVRACGAELVFYALDAQLAPRVDGLGAGDWLLYVDYFGVCGAVVDELLKRYDRSQVVVDHAQSFFTAPRDCLATLYSPRKFFGIPDGGLLVTRLEMSEPEALDERSIERSLHLLTRLDRGAEAGYAGFKAADASLNDVTPRRMSNLTDRLLGSIDYEASRAARNANFRALHEALASFNQLPLDVGRIDAPLCYPLLQDSTSARERLIARRYFVPMYWPGVAERVGPGTFEAKLARQCLALPCDQRYGEAEMADLAAAASGLSSQ